MTIINFVDVHGIYQAHIASTRLERSPPTPELIGLESVHGRLQGLGNGKVLQECFRVSV